MEGVRLVEELVWNTSGQSIKLPQGIEAPTFRFTGSRVN